MSSALAGLSEQQKIVFGVVGIVVGAGLLAVMTFTSFTSGLTDAIVGIIGVAFAIVGTLLLGTSETRDQIV
jgi:hypothetical protein